jgi:hypothetical protein
MKPYVLVWSEAAWPMVMALPRTKMLDLRRHCHLLIWLAEYFRARPNTLALIGRVEALRPEDLPFAPFRRHGCCFQLKCVENEYFRQREYWVMPADDPPPAGPASNDHDGAAPAVKTSRKRSQAPQGEARPARARKPKKASLRKLLISYKAYNMEMIDRICFAIWPKLARSVQEIRESAEKLVRLGLEGAKNLAVCLQRINEAARRIRASLEAPSLGVETPVSRYGRFETRVFGQNLGMHLLLSTIVLDDAPIDWSADLFGVPDQDRERATA